MDPVDIARWQFGITTVYHFLFVPLTIGLSALVAILETAWIRTGKTAYLRATKFWGKLFLINFAMGIVTGIVQEFQFGMNWSDYSRFVGDVFGAPLAIEGLLAFFVESTFLGLWIFGWDRLPKLLHVMCMWLVSIGTVLSAFFILAANSWMQNPVGYRIDEETGRAVLTDFWAVLTNPVHLAAFPHTITAAFVTGGMFMAGVSAWHLARRKNVEVFRPSLKLALGVTLVASIGVAISGDLLGKTMTERQPMKMAAAEAIYETERPAGLSLFAVGTPDGGEEIFGIKVPAVLSFLSTGSWDGEVRGINDLQAEAEAAYGPGDYRPFVPVTYWNFRLMVGVGLLTALISAAGLVLLRRRGLPASPWIYRVGVLSLTLPFIANSAGWIFTEMGRQPWSVYGVLKTSASVSPGVSAGSMLISVVALTALYGVLMVIEAGLMIRYAKAGPPSEDEVLPPDSADDDDSERSLAFAY
ncbi:cytochrome ubiquinol oxidase subunit I [Actinomadura livida]|uniref:Cytochrome d ubiquinol oxidase subunit I n=1 Tax=Actinomadura livida TaxID=79909 RepID=A0A7W7N1I8_9ACTN|nr:MULTISPECIES: cytochrome ubiquinol oxidase subunit I [Actinomadura]MBB4779033.1 cytochrome d ubiquinol oxidase subunit I [Actinomadura catellatispora]GGU01179.1 cytochrome ubiquinol oxidase subunit I [Actinomadura livida]